MKTNDEPLAVATEDVVDGFGSFLKVIKLHDDAAKPCMILPERLNYNLEELEFLIYATQFG